MPGALLGSDYLFEAILLPFLALSLAGVGLNLLTGYTGQVSLGSAAFLAIGAYAAFNLNLRAPGLPLPITIALAGFAAAADRRRFRAAEPAAAGFLSRGLDARRAVLRAMGAHQISLVLQQLQFRRDRRARHSKSPGYAFASPLGRYYFTLTVVALLTASPGA